MAFDLDRETISAIISGIVGLDDVKTRQFVSSDFGEYKDAFEFVVWYRNEYHSYPTCDVVEAKVGIRLEQPTTTADFILTELCRRRLFIRLSSLMTEAVRVLNKREPYEARRLLLKGLKDLELSDGGSAITPEEGAALVWQAYLDRKTGKLGIPMPWKSLNDALNGGLRAGDIAYFVARYGRAKTWMSVLFGSHAAWKGYRTLLISPEKTRLDLLIRYVSIKYKIPNRMIRLGAVGEFAEGKLESELALLDNTPLFFVGNEQACTIANIEANVIEYRPDLLIVDGTYLIGGAKAEKRHEQAAETAIALKALGGIYQIPIIATTQFNREVQADRASSFTEGRVALTDVIEWSSTVIYALIRTEEQKKEKILRLKPLKISEGEGWDMDIRFDLDNLIFDEIDSDKPFTEAVPVSQEPQAEEINDEPEGLPF